MIVHYETPEYLNVCSQGITMELNIKKIISNRDEQRQGRVLADDGEWYLPLSGGFVPQEGTSIVVSGNYYLGTIREENASST